jgi:hypothetical protein
MRSILVLSILTLYAGIAQAQPQTFSSGSTGADGALTYAANLGTVYFPPSGLAQRANNIYNFTTITIGAGTTVRVSGWAINSAVYWLAQSDVTIAGTLDISGQPGHAPNSPAYRAPSEPGAGGYSGGVALAGTGQSATRGNGPGGGAAAIAPSPFGGGGTFSESSYLQPLIGGSGGGGGSSGYGGGAGGGAILIASSTMITIPSGGTIDARGGSNPTTALGGGGSGGAVRLVSNTIAVTGTIYIAGGTAYFDSQNGTGKVNYGGPGIVRLEGFALSGVGQVNGGTALTSFPYNLALPVGGPSTVSVTKVNNVSINANPFSFPDATITAGTAVPVVISGVNIPSGTTGNLNIYSENAADQVIPFTLTGTLQSTTATVNVPYPSGGSRGFAKAVWTSQ